jgi:hypothetical protein
MFGINESFGYWKWALLTPVFEGAILLKWLSNNHEQKSQKTAIHFQPFPCLSTTNLFERPRLTSKYLHSEVFPELFDKRSTTMGENTINMDTAKIAVYHSII